MSLIIELSAIKELNANLNDDDKLQLKELIKLPDGFCYEITKGTNFITALNRWPGHNAFRFHQSLNSIRPDLVEVACKVKWLCVSSSDQLEHREEGELSVRTLIELLKSELSREDCDLIYMTVTGNAEENVHSEKTLKKLLEMGFIDKELKELKAFLDAINRKDLIEKLKPYQNAFSVMDVGDFESKFEREIENNETKMKQWEKKLKNFEKTQSSKVEQMLGDTESVNLEDVFIDLTILNKKPREININDETTYNDIAYLRKIVNKEIEITTVDFEKELASYTSREPEIWCLIANPGFGKSFLAKRTALRYSKGELVGILYTISIPCYNTEWHSMESTQYENKLKFETEYISKWLCLGLPKGPNWSKDLAKHLIESDGEGLLLIIDGLDEFTRKIPFGKTFLCLLLTRQSLTRSTIIITCRPGAWTDISSEHELKIDRYYQVLGFSPENRDLYFTKQITNLSKLKACLELMERHDEMKQLSLIPVNASLFAALLKGEDSAAINTLTKWYSELTLYMIRRELSKIGLQEFSRVAQLSDFHPDIQECLEKIGLIAFLGVANRAPMSEKIVPLNMGPEEYPSHCLGLAHEHYKKEAVGLVKKVWSFAHLTMQEYTAAHWLSNNTWTEQCYSIRYISHSTDNFSLFKMLVRFLCGILSDKSAAILSIMYRSLTPQRTQLINMPMTYQLMYHHSHELIPSMGIPYFAQIYFQLTSMLFETNSESIPKWFSRFIEYLPLPFQIFIEETVTPNEWFCFLQSFQFISKINLISFSAEHITSLQFKCLFKEICFVESLAISFNNSSSAAVLEYTNLISDADFKFDTKISIDLSNCNMSDTTAVELFSATTKQKLFLIRIMETKISDTFLEALADQLTTLDCIVLPNWYEKKYYLEESLPPIDYDILLPSLFQATQLRVLHLNGFPEEYDSDLRTILPNFSNLEEIQLDSYSQLTALPKLSCLTYLRIGDPNSSKEKKTPNISINLLQQITDNRHKLKIVELFGLYSSGLRSCSLFLNKISLCTKLVLLELRDISLPADNTSEWSSIGKNLKILVMLKLQHFTLYDTGFESLCAGLEFHPTIRELVVANANLTSLSCDLLMLLIPTVTQLEILTVSDLEKPDVEAHKLLWQTADEYSIKLGIVMD